MIRKDYTHERAIKTHIFLRGWWKAYRGRWIETVIRHGSMDTNAYFLIGSKEYRFFNQSGVDLETWLAENARGSYQLEARLTTMQGPMKKHHDATIFVRFTDRNSALKFKLTLGGSLG